MNNEFKKGEIGMLEFELLTKSNLKLNASCEPDDYTSVNCDPDAYGDYSCGPDYSTCNPD